MEPSIGWQGMSACRKLTPKESDRIFQDQQGIDPGVKPNIETRAARWFAVTRYCYGCPVMKQCLESNLKDQDGTYGGLDRGARYVLRQRRDKVVKPRRAIFLARLCWEMERCGYDRDEIAEHLGETRAFVDASVSRWCQTAESETHAREWRAWRMLHAGKRMVDVARETGLEYDHVVLMKAALVAVEQGKEEKACKVSRLSSPIAGPSTTAA